MLHRGCRSAQGLAGGFLYIAANAKMESLRGSFSSSPLETEK
jgi:hypothetical protein